MTTEKKTPLRLRLEQHYQITAEAGRLLDEAEHEERAFPADTIILDHKDRNTQFISIESGWMSSYRETRDGAKQIVNFLLPGDLVNPDATSVVSLDHAVRSLTPVKLRFIDKQAMGRILQSAPSLIAGLWWTSAQEKGLLQAQVVRVGRQRANIRVCNMLLELHRRLLLVEPSLESSSHELPLTQQHLADALGLSAVHVNRVVSHLRREGLVRTRRASIEVLDRDRLASLGGFDPSHFHLDSNALESLFV